MSNPIFSEEKKKVYFEIFTQNDIKQLQISLS